MVLYGNNTVQLSSCWQETQFWKKQKSAPQWWLRCFCSLIVCISPFSNIWIDNGKIFVAICWLSCFHCRSCWWIVVFCPLLISLLFLLLLLLFVLNPSLTMIFILFATPADCWPIFVIFYVNQSKNDGRSFVYSLNAWHGFLRMSFWVLWFIICGWMIYPISAQCISASLPLQRWDMGRATTSPWQWKKCWNAWWDYGFCPWRYASTNQYLSKRRFEISWNGLQELIYRNWCRQNFDGKFRWTFYRKGSGGIW